MLLYPPPDYDTPRASVELLHDVRALLRVRGAGEGGGKVREEIKEAPDEGTIQSGSGPDVYLPGPASHLYSVLCLRSSSTKFCATR